MTQMRIVVLGSFVQACCWRVKQLPAPGETLAASALSIEAGGKGLNVAIGCKRLGAEVELLLGIGQDQAGDSLLQLLEREGLPVEHIWRLTPQSAYGAGLIADNGQNVIAVYPGPNLMLTAEHVQCMQAAIASAKLVYGQFETSLPAIAEAFRLARLHGVRTLLNPSPWQAIPQALLNDTDVLIVNEQEVGHLLGKPLLFPESLSDCAELLQNALACFWFSWLGSLVVVTLGARGCVAIERSGAVVCAPAYVVAAVDTVGAGDAFASGLCMAFSKAASLPQALRQANACGAIVASQVGVVDALPDQAKLCRFMSLT